jgi:hypothetical protein
MWLSQILKFEGRKEMRLQEEQFGQILSFTVKGVGNEYTFDGIGNKTSSGFSHYVFNLDNRTTTKYGVSELLKIQESGRSYHPLEAADLQREALRDIGDGEIKKMSLF